MVTKFANLLSNHKHTGDIFFYCTPQILLTLPQLQIRAVSNSCNAYVELHVVIDVIINLITFLLVRRENNNSESTAHFILNIIVILYLVILRHNAIELQSYIFYGQINTQTNQQLNYFIE